MRVFLFTLLFAIYAEEAPSYKDDIVAIVQSLNEPQANPIEIKKKLNQVINQKNREMNKYLSKMRNDINKRHKESLKNFKDKQNAELSPIKDNSKRKSIYQRQKQEKREFLKKHKEERSAQYNSIKTIRAEMRNFIKEQRQIFDRVYKQIRKSEQQQRMEKSKEQDPLLEEFRQMPKNKGIELYPESA